MRKRRTFGLYSLPKAHSGLGENLEGWNKNLGPLSVVQIAVPCSSCLPHHPLPHLIVQQSRFCCSGCTSRCDCYFYSRLHSPRTLIVIHTVDSLPLKTLLPWLPGFSSLPLLPHFWLICSPLQTLFPWSLSMALPHGSSCEAYFSLSISSSTHAAAVPRVTSGHVVSPIFLFWNEYTLRRSKSDKVPRTTHGHLKLNISKFCSPFSLLWWLLSYTTYFSDITSDIALLQA